MEHFSANYSITNNNFTIENLKKNIDYKNKYFPVICILKNIIQRGCPTKISEFLSQYIKKTDISKEKIYFIDNETPEWLDLIKGDDENSYYPAKEFFYNIIPEYLQEYKYIQQLILPEAYINDITGVESEKFYNQCVDFYLPQAKLVIEIDGMQHREYVNRVMDRERDIQLKNNGTNTIRISTKAIKEKGIEFKGKIQEIRNQLNKSQKDLEQYEKYYKLGNDLFTDKTFFNSVTATAIIRFQITILMLIERGHIRLDDKVWDIKVINRDVVGYEEIAINDLFLWLNNLCKLNRIPFIEPKVNIRKSNQNVKNINLITIDFSLKKRWTTTDRKTPGIIFVRTDYYEDENYFKVSTSDPIKYDLIIEEDNSDKPILQFFLKNIFGFGTFKDGQLPIIINVLACYDTIGLLPTGSGKSICYQLAALLQPCISFVVVPIKSLMYDQKANLDKKGITHTDFISSDQESKEKEKVQKGFSEGKFIFIWISPERFQIKSFRNYLDELNRNLVIGMAVIDEVHCLSEWGHDFRTSYLNLAKTIRTFCPSSIFLGLTATASEHVLKDILIDFEIPKSSVKTMKSFTRSELTFQVIKDSSKTKKDKKKELDELINKLSIKKNIFEIDGENTKNGIIFTPNVNGESGCYELSGYLSKKYNQDVRWYSGTIPKINKQDVMKVKEFNEYKRIVQKEYQESKFPLLVATKAFGMGIDKSNIRYTIHYGIPSSLEALYQEAGRAGRDGERAGCYILYSKEIVDEEKLNVIFDINTTLEDIKNINKEFSFKGRDILKNIFMWSSSKNSLDQDFNEINSVMTEYAKPNEKDILIQCEKIKMSLAELQQTLYKMRLIGIVEDWTIEDWNQNSGKITVEFSDFDDKRIKDSLENYIRKYEKFSLDNIGSDKTYNSLIYEGMESYELAAKVLLKWQYENISYGRRQSIKNLSDLCANYTDSKKFQKHLEDYFKFSDSVYNLDNIADNPDDYDSWISVFFKKQRKEDSKLSKQEIESTRNSLSRFLESYRNNTGLNYVSGILRLILNDYGDKDGKVRLVAAFNEINKFNNEEKAEILKGTLKIGQTYMDEQNKQELSKLLIDTFENQQNFIYRELDDNYSLNFIINKSTKEIENLRGKLK